MTLKPDTQWFGIHVFARTPQDAVEICSVLPRLAGMGINTLIVEVNYNYAFTSHPELRGPNPLTAEDARLLAEACRAHGVRLIPQFMCLGHQSWAEETFPLLVQYPELDETPGQYPNNEGIYCRSWCPRHPQVNPLVFALMGELLEAFQADALHVGLDEVFLIASEHCPRCRGGDPGEIFAEATLAYHDFLVRQRGVEMLMWSDRLLDDAAMGYGEWESARNGTHTAISRLPRDIILCDWHYEVGQNHPSVPFFIQEGFRVLPSGWREPQAVQEFITDSQKSAGPQMLGYLCTTWGAVKPVDLPDWLPLQTAHQLLISR
jgi:hypothetical protein